MNYIQPISLQLEIFFGAIWSFRLLSYENMAYNGLNQSQDDESDYNDAPSFSNVSEFAAVSGCVAQLDGAEKNTYGVCHISAFLTLKNRENLFKPAPSVMSVCTETEKCFPQMLNINIR